MLLGAGWVLNWDIHDISIPPEQKCALAVNMKEV
jgi:hypothetical protein